METQRRFCGGCSSERDNSLCCMRGRHRSVGSVLSLPCSWSSKVSIGSQFGNSHRQAKPTHRPVATMLCIPGSVLLIQVGSKEVSGMCGGELASKHPTSLARFFMVQLVSSRPKQENWQQRYVSATYFLTTSTNYYCIYLDINPWSWTLHLWKLGRASDAPVSSLALGV